MNHIGRVLSVKSAIAYVIIGVMFGVSIFSVPFVILLLIADRALAPPMQQFGNYGQVGMLVLYLIPFGAVSGVTCGAIPLLKFHNWLFVYIFTSQTFFFLIIADSTCLSAEYMAFLGSTIMFAGAIWFLSFVMRMLVRFEAENVF